MLLLFTGFFLKCHFDMHQTLEWKNVKITYWQMTIAKSKPCSAHRCWHTRFYFCVNSLCHCFLASMYWRAWPSGQHPLGKKIQCMILASWKKENWAVKKVGTYLMFQICTTEITKILKTSVAKVKKFRCKKEQCFQMSESKVLWLCGLNNHYSPILWF